MLKRFFILCSGADRDLLSNCSDGEQTKYVGIGATVFFTAVMAFLANSYALFTVFDNTKTAVIFGVIWAFLIFNLDRFIVSTIRKRDNLRYELLQATPRIILAMIIAIVISKPLEIKIFEKEINTVLLKEKNQLAMANKKQVSDYFKSDLDKNKAELPNHQNIRSQLTLYCANEFFKKNEVAKGVLMLSKTDRYWGAYADVLRKNFYHQLNQFLIPKKCIKFYKIT